MEDNKESYKQIFKSTSIVGGAQIINIIIGIVRNKVIAILLGPSGVGIVGIYQSIVELVKSGTGLGINFSGVKSIAESNTDIEKVSKTILVLRRWEFSTGLIGTLIIIFLCNFFSNYSFGNNNYTYSIAFMSIISLISAVSAGQLAILQGLRKIKEMAKATLLGSVLGTIISLPLYAWLGVSGIVPAMILTALGSLIVSWLYSKKVKIVAVNITYSETFKEGLGMAKLGFFIVFNGFVATASLYLVRALIRDHLGLDSVGYFQAVWIISTMYINILLNSMIADYFPRLSALKDDIAGSNKLINQQLEMTLLVGTPMLMCMIAFATLAMNILYTSSFNSAIPVLRWQMAASFLTFISYTIGVLYLSKNKGWYAIISETLRQVVYIAFVYIGWNYFGFDVLGIGFLGANFISLIFVYFSVRKINLFSLTSINKKQIVVLFSFVTLSLICSLYLESYVQYICNGALIIFACFFCVHRLNQLLDLKAWFNARLKR